MHIQRIRRIFISLLSYSYRGLFPMHVLPVYLKHVMRQLALIKTVSLFSVRYNMRKVHDINVASVNRT